MEQVHTAREERPRRRGLVASASHEGGLTAELGGERGAEQRERNPVSSGRKGVAGHR